MTSALESVLETTGASPLLFFVLMNGKICSSQQTGMDDMQVLERCISSLLTNTDFLHRLLLLNRLDLQSK